MQDRAVSASTPSPARLRFGRLDLDTASGQLRVAGRRVALQPKPLEVLSALLERPGEVVTREELRARLWPTNTFVEFDDGLNHAVRKLRQALKDSIEDPKFIETLPRYGYRLIASRARPAKPGLKIRSLAVLPMANLSDDPQQEYFADGMTDALITVVSKLQAVKVISRTSVMRYKGMKKPLPQIAQELGVEGVIEGAVQRSGGQVRITLQLIHARTDTHLWAESYERNIQDVFALQSEVARAVAREINAALTPNESTRSADTHPVCPEAYEAYLKGQFHWYKLSPGHLDRALAYFQLALEKDPHCALAQVGIANVWMLRTDTGLLPATEAFPKARVAALRAAELDEALAEVHVTLANIAVLYDRDWSAGEREFLRAIELNPNSADARLMYADFLISMKRSQEWATEIRRVLELDPLNPFFQCFYGWHLLYLHQCDDAILHLREANAADPGFSSAHMGLWGAFYRKGLYEDALAEAVKFFAVLGDREMEHALSAGYAEGGYQKAMHLAAECMTDRSRRNHVPSVRVARLYAHAGDNDRAIEWLQSAFEQRESPLMHLGVGWDWDALHADRRFQDLLRRIGLAEY